MIFNQIKYKRQNNNIEIPANILSSMAGGYFSLSNNSEINHNPKMES